MDQRKGGVKLDLAVENDCLIMFGSAVESAGCTLRGVVRLSVAHTIKIKSLSVRFMGRAMLTYCDSLGNSSERLYQHEEQAVLDERVVCLEKQSKLHVVEAGVHTYQFEFAVCGNLPETTHVANFIQVEYKLKALLERPAFIPNISTRQAIHLARQLYSPFSPEFMEPVQMIKRHDDLEARVTLPTKIYAYGDTIDMTIELFAQNPAIRPTVLTCNLKEYVIIGHDVDDEDNARHGRHLYSNRITQFTRSQHDASWTKQLAIPVPSSRNQMHCDMDNDRVKVRHKFKLIFDFIDTQSGIVKQMRIAIPITMCALSLNTHELPAYESAAQDIAYDADPSSVIRDLRQVDVQRPQNMGLPAYNDLDRLPPTYDDLPSAMAC
ncbi:hypothetical protein BC940DRAFT_333610 [Gongronella butleri]|nr:hypothetical protein BC940DRAFT_333610 [Gongronella butleri]